MRLTFTVELIFRCFFCWEASCVELNAKFMMMSWNCFSWERELVRFGFSESMLCFMQNYDDNNWISNPSLELHKCSKPNEKSLKGFIFLHIYEHTNIHRKRFPSHNFLSLFSLVCSFNSHSRPPHTLLNPCDFLSSTLLTDAFSFRMSNKKEICCKNLSEMKKKLHTWKCRRAEARVEDERG